MAVRTCSCAHGDDPPVRRHSHHARPHSPSRISAATTLRDQADPPRARCLLQAPDGRSTTAVPLSVDDGVDRRHGADDPLADRDDHQQAVALRDVLGVPGRPAAPALGDDRSSHLQTDQRQRDRESGTDRKVNDCERDPAHLCDLCRDVDRRGSATCWVIARHHRQQRRNSRCLVELRITEYDAGVCCEGRRTRTTRTESSN